MQSHEILPGAYLLESDGKRRLATRSSDPIPVYGERISNGCRSWDPFRSKLAALLLKGGGEGLPLRRDAKVLYLGASAKVLYLGASTGTTVSHVSDIVRDGIVYAVELSPRSMRDLIRLCERRDNIVPIFADAARPEAYSPLVEPVDLIYQDVAQRNQAQIASMNCKRYLKPGGDLILMLKTRCVDVTSSPSAVYRSEIDELHDLDVFLSMDLLPFHQDHWAIMARKSLQ